MMQLTESCITVSMINALFVRVLGTMFFKFSEIVRNEYHLCFQVVGLIQYDGERTYQPR